MPEIVALLQTLTPIVSATLLRQMSQVIYGMLATSGRVTMLGISRWTENGGSYRTIQRWYHSCLPWAQMMWLLFTKLLWQSGAEYIAAGDEVVLGKAGKETYGLGRFFSGLQQRVIPGLSFFVFSLIAVQGRHSYPLQATQVVKATAEPKKVKPLNKKTKKGAVGRPKGSQNKREKTPTLSPELARIQGFLQAFLSLIGQKVTLVYLVLDGHFGNFPSAWLVRQAGLHLISKLRVDAALYEPYRGEYSGCGRHRKYGKRVDVHKLKPEYLQSEKEEDGIRTQIYTHLAVVQVSSRTAQ